jgi:hypothetical protein
MSTNTNTMNINNPFDMSLAGMSANSNDLWDFASSSNYVWPSGFTPEGQCQGSNTSINQSQNQNLHLGMGQQGQGQGQGLSNHFQMPSVGEPTIGHFMNTSPGTDMRLINALESGAAYIEGNPAEDEDIELFYYRFVSSLCQSSYDDTNNVSLGQQRSILESTEYRSNYKNEMALPEPLLNPITTSTHSVPPPLPTCLTLVVYPIHISTCPYSTFSSSTCLSISPRYPVNG